MKLELKHLAGYLPYGLKIEHPTMLVGKRNISELRNLGQTNIEISHRLYVQISECKPILRPLSDLTKEIEVNGEKFVPIDEIAEIEEVVCTYSIEFFETSIKYLPNWITEKLLEWHFDIHGLIENDLAIDKNLC